MRIKRLENLGVAPTPWQCQDIYWVKDARGSDVVDCYRRNENEAQVKADSRLIAAAPDLYEALRLILASLDAIGFVPTVKEDALVRSFERGVWALEKAGGCE